MERPVTHYATTDDDVHIAYQVFGDGPIDLVFVQSFVSHVEIFWELPSYERLMRELASWARVIVLDKRGTGLSDRLSAIPTLEARLDDLRAVLDAVGSERTIIFGDGEGAALAALFASTHPERTLGLLLFGGTVRIAQAPDYPWGMPEETFEQRLRIREEIWGDASKGEETAAMTFRVGQRLAEDEVFLQWLMRIQRYGAAPGDLIRFSRVWFTTDARSVLPAIQAPTTVLVRDGWSSLVEESEWTAGQIPGAHVVRLGGDEDDPWLGDVVEVAEAARAFADAIEEEHAAFDRVLATVLFTDIVGSSERAVELGDRGWKDLVERHHAKVRALLGRFRGHEVDTAGDGFSQRSTGPAVRCDARRRSSDPSGRSGSKSAPGSIRARSRRSTERPADSRSWSDRGSGGSRVVQRCWPPRPCATSRQGRGSCSRTRETTTSRVSRTAGMSTVSRDEGEPLSTLRLERLDEDTSSALGRRPAAFSSGIGH